VHKELLKHKNKERHKLLKVLSGLAQTQFGQQTRELGQLEAVGREQQQREQQLLDESYQRFLQERAFPEQQLAQYQGIVTGASPLIGTSTVQRTPQQFQPSPLASALGTAAQVADIYGTFSRANQPNLFLSQLKKVDKLYLLKVEVVYLF
jgi:hypothetical protein